MDCMLEAGYFPTTDQVMELWSNDKVTKVFMNNLPSNAVFLPYDPALLEDWDKYEYVITDFHDRYPSSGTWHLVLNTRVVQDPPQVEKRRFHLKWPSVVLV